MLPKPYFLARRSGLYVRFLVPLDLREAVGSRFLIRTFGSARGDRSRFVAAVLAMALSEAFARMRAEAGMVDVKKLLESAQRAAQAGEGRPWTASNVRIGGVDFDTVQTTAVVASRVVIARYGRHPLLGEVPCEMVAQESYQSGGRQSASSNNRDLRPRTRTRFQ